MIKNTITTIGGATKDIMYYTKDAVLIDNKKDILRKELIGFEYGAKVYSKKVYITFGGGGANTAVSLANLGIKTQTILSLGNDDISNEIIKHLKSKKVNINNIVKNNTQTAFSFIVNAGKYNEHVIFAYRGANDNLILNKSLVKKINTPWVYLSSLPKNSKLSMLFDHCKNKNIAWNPGSNQLKLGLKKLAKYIKKTKVFDVNKDEALELLFSVKKKVNGNIRSVIKELHQYGQELTVITDGHKGAYVYDGNKIYFRPALKRKGINTTGAGDAFGSSFVAGLIKYNDIEQALKLGILNSNSVIMKIGAQEGLLYSKDIKNI